MRCPPLRKNIGYFSKKGSIMDMWNTASDVVRTFNNRGNHYFSKDTMRFFKSKVERGFWPTTAQQCAGILIVSNQFEDDPRIYSVMYAWQDEDAWYGEDKCDIRTQETCPTLAEARTEAKKLAELAYQSQVELKTWR